MRASARDYPELERSKSRETLALETLASLDLSSASVHDYEQELVLGRVEDAAITDPDAWRFALRIERGPAHRRPFPARF
ncbi:hypothetical protein [Sinomonas albida]|uniref:hypothetical protein n=1 Tax=Sinomonas albida TaxID=369942 RepID=UPI0030197663